MDNKVLNQRTAVTRTQINYLFICPTKLWYFSHQIWMEHSSDLVATGKFIHEDTYKREQKEIKIDGIAIDFIKRGDTLELHEIKKSKTMEKAHEMQTLYYLYVLKNKGVKATAFIDYPLIRERKQVELNEQNERELEEAITKVKEITALELPPEAKRVPFCPKCAYYELCWSDA